MIAVGFGVFVAAVALDFAAARYQRALRESRVHAASAWSVAMCLLSSVALLALVDVSRWMLVPEAAGLYVGTLLGARATLRG